MYNSKILATGSYLPKRLVTNADLEKMVDTTNEWILERTGIEQRHISSPEGGEFPADMAYFATKDALERAQLTPNDIDFIIFASVTGEYQFPSSAALLQNKLGITNECPCMDLAAACSGFIYGLQIADTFVKTGLYKNILIVGADMLSAFTNWNDRTTCVLFGDGAGVAIVGRTPEGDNSQVLSSVISCDGSGAELLVVPAGGSKKPSTAETVAKNEEKIFMEGRQIFKYATRTMLRNARQSLSDADLNPQTLDWLIPHQANLRIIEYITQKLEIDRNKVIVTVDKYGNNSAATIPIALDKAITDGRIVRGHSVALVAFGAGVTSGGAVLRY